MGDKAFGDCLCGTPGTCKTQCAATYCAGKEPTQGDACDTCMTGATACDTAAQTACNANADCVAFSACVKSASCDTKP